MTHSSTVVRSRRLHAAACSVRRQCCCAHIADVTCSGGCSCQPTILQGRWEQQTTQLDQQRISVSQVLRQLIYSSPQARANQD